MPGGRRRIAEDDAGRMNVPPVIRHGGAAPPALPGVAVAEGKPEPSRGAPRWGWLVMLGLMLAYIVAMTVLARHHGGGGPAMSGEVGELVLESAASLGIFAGLFGVGLACVWRGRREVWGQRPHTLWTWGWGALWFVVLRVAAALPVLVVAVVLQLQHGPAALEKVKALRPKIESLMPPESLGDPLYALACMTWISFVVAGLREELWRAAFLRGFRALFPGGGGTVSAWAGVGVSSVLFGLAHLPQGWMGVALTTVLGLGLGAVQVARRSTWEAVVAHGLVDASTFFLLFVIQNPTTRGWLQLPPDFARQVLGG